MFSRKAGAAPSHGIPHARQFLRKPAGHLPANGRLVQRLCCLVLCACVVGVVRLAGALPHCRLGPQRWVSMNASCSADCSLPNKVKLKAVLMVSRIYIFCWVDGCRLYNFLALNLPCPSTVQVRSNWSARQPAVRLVASQLHLRLR